MSCKNVDSFLAIDFFFYDPTISQVYYMFTCPQVKIDDLHDRSRGKEAMASI